MSTQVINEICVNLIKKARFSEEKVRDLIDAFYTKYPAIEPDRAMRRDDSTVRERYILSFWDGLIVAAALSSGVEALYSEDMQDGLMIESRLRIINPFLRPPLP